VAGESPLPRSLGACRPRTSATSCGSVRTLDCVGFSVALSQKPHRSRSKLWSLRALLGELRPFSQETVRSRRETYVVLRLDLLIVDEFRDAGVSGTKDLDNRPGLAALFDRVESNEVTLVLVENAMRLARNLMVGEVILQQLTSAGCKVIATDSATDLSADSDDPTRRLIRQVLGAGPGGRPTEWAELVQAHDDRNVFQASPDELPVIDIHIL